MVSKNSWLPAEMESLLGYIKSIDSEELTSEDLEKHVAEHNQKFDRNRSYKSIRVILMRYAKKLGKNIKIDCGVYDGLSNHDPHTVEYLTEKLQKFERRILTLVQKHMEFSEELRKLVHPKRKYQKKEQKLLEAYI
jgi:hypothetical protein